CDTFADYSDDDAERATALVAAAIIKTIKIYETEPRFRFKRLAPSEWPKYEGTHLFDGLYSFNIGYGDVISNLKERIQNLCRRRSPTAKILEEVFNRI